MTFEQVVRDSGCPVSSVARLFKVTRQTLYYWMQGHEPTSEINIAFKNKIYEALKKGFTNGDMPIRPDVQDKYKALAAVVRKNVG